MIIKQWKNSDEPIGFMIDVTKSEAVSLIRSLANQLNNQGRVEFTAEMRVLGHQDTVTQGHYFSVAVGKNKE